MIYLDNAATTLEKPPCVAEAVSAALASFGGVGRGVHPASIAAGRAVFDARSRIASLLGAPSASRVSFASNATMALNIAIQGLASPGARVVTTAASHNSVLRPLFRLRDEAGATVEVAPVRPDGSLDFDAFEALLAGGSTCGPAPAAACASSASAPPTLVVATHASNLTGDVYDVSRMAAAAHDTGALFVLDAAQTAGSIPIDFSELGADVLCFTGHKSLLGPQGTGGLIVRDGLDVPPLLEGGSGTHTFDERHPRFMPDSLEAGTLNAHGLAGLAASAAWLAETGVCEVAAHSRALVERFERGVADIAGARVLGGGEERRGGGSGGAVGGTAAGGMVAGEARRTGVVALATEADSSLVADALARDFGICTRAGAHCAPLMHRALGTEESGAVRFSFSWYTTEDDIDVALDALREVL